MLPPESTTPTRLRGEDRRVGEQRGERGCARALGHGLLHLEQQQHRGLERLLLDEQDLAHVLADDRKGQPAGLLHGDPARDRRVAARDRLARERLLHGRKARRLHAEDLEPRAQRVRGERDAGEQPPAADGRDERIEIGNVGEHLERQRALTRDHLRVVVGVHEDEPALARERARDSRRVLERVALEHDLGAEHAGVLDLRGGREARHHDDRTDAEPLRVVGDALGVIARRHRDHAGRALGRRERARASRARRAP